MIIQLTMHLLTQDDFQKPMLFWIFFLNEFDLYDFVILKVICPALLSQISNLAISYLVLTGYVV